MNPSGKELRLTPDVPADVNTLLGITCYCLPMDNDTAARHLSNLHLSLQFRAEKINRRRLLPIAQRTHLHVEIGEQRKALEVAYLALIGRPMIKERT